MNTLMEGRPPDNWANGNDSRSLAYRLKVEIRRVEREGEGETPYAEALRRVLRVTSEHEKDDVLGVIEGEIHRLEAGGNDPIQAEALRKALSIIDPPTRSRRELFSYYLRKMEQEGRGDEPFAQALRRALDAPEGPSLDALFDRPDQSGSTSLA